MPSDDQSRNSVLFAILAFNFMVIFCFILFMIGIIPGWLSFYLITGVLASLAAAGGFYFGKMYG